MSRPLLEARTFHYKCMNLLEDISLLIRHRFFSCIPSIALLYWIIQKPRTEEITLRGLLK
jgi:hypothetical protein